MIVQQKFSKDFLWGASTASHQVEGGTVNQWSVWELEHASELAASAQKRYGNLPDWHRIKAEAENPDNYVSGQAIDHYNRYPEDFDLLQKLQFNSLRFGIEWSRLEPEEGAFNLDAVKHYHGYIDDLLERGITPVLNLWHWTMPTWFADKGGFANKENLPLFDAFVERVAQEYGDKLKYILTLNEPNVYTKFGYQDGIWPPGVKKVGTAIRVYLNLIKAHKRAYTIIKRHNPALQVGVAAQLANVQAKRPHNLIDGATTKIMRYGWNWFFLNHIRRYQDFIGVNYYFTDYYHGLNGKDTPQVPMNDMGWYMEPEGLFPLLMRTWDRYRKPIIVTENGVADADDQYRQWWLEQTVIAMQRAVSEGVDLRGYFHWSLLDNFEWRDGWWPKFGLIAVDHEHDLKRTPRPSAIWFAKYLMELQGRERPVLPLSPGAKKKTAAAKAAGKMSKKEVSLEAEAATAEPLAAPPAGVTVEPTAKASGRHRLTSRLSMRPRTGARGAASAAGGPSRPTRIQATSQSLQLAARRLRHRKVQ